MIVIVFPHDWPHKSPALLQLLEDFNRAQLEYELHLPINAKRNWELNKAKYFDASLNLFSRIAIRALIVFSFLDNFLIKYITRNILHKDIKTKSGDTLICFDFFGYSSIIRQHSFKKKYIFSTELFLYHKNIFNLLDPQDLCLIIQSKIRANFLGFSSSEKVRISDNVKIDQEFIPSSKLVNDQHIRSGLLYSGSICPELGEKILQKLGQDSKRTYQLTIHGDINISVEQVNKLTIIKEFLSDFNLKELMFKSKVGIVLYDFKHISRLRSFNFETGPSGKLLKYILCGLPVIGNKCDGLIEVERFNAGILLKNLTTEEINLAYNKIIENYDFYEKGVRNFFSEILNRRESMELSKWF
jgi:glycosyltransferase involved in cell wall biosynthesis